MMFCRTVRKRLIDCLDAGSPPALPKELAAHLESCPDCARYYDEARQTLSALQPKSRVRPSTDFKERVMNQIVATHTEERNTAINRNRAWFLQPAWIMGMAAILIAGVLAVDLFSPSPSSNNAGISVPSLLSQAWANEQAMFDNNGILHMVNQIAVPPVQDESLSKARWFPLFTLGADGKPRFHQLSLPSEPGKGYSVTDEVWYDPAQKRYIRLIKKQDQTIFAAAFDGTNLYTTESGDNNQPAIASKPVTSDFKAPENPIDFLGIYPGFASLLKEGSQSQVEFVEDTKLDDGTEVSVLKAVTPQPQDAQKNAMLFKINKSNNTLAEVEWNINGASYLVARRIKTETIDRPESSWNLEGVQLAQPSKDSSAQPGVNADMVVPNVTVQHMIEKATFDAYLFAQNPSWTSERVITDVLDLPSPPKRMFMIVYKAADKRNIVLIQAHTYNQMMGALAKQGKLIYESKNGFKVWSTPQDKMGAKIALQSTMSVTQTPPAEDCTGYFLESPSGTFPALAINGTVTDEELHALIDSLIPAKEYKE